MQELFESVFSKIVGLVRLQIEAAETNDDNKVKVWDSTLN